MVSHATEGINMSMAAVGAADYARSIDGLNLSQAKLLLTLQGMDAEQQESLLLQAGLISSSDQMQARHVAQALSTTALGEAEKNRILTKLGLIDAETGEILTSQTCTKEKLLQALATTTLDETEKEELVTKILGTSGNVKYALSFKVLAGAIWDSIKAMAKWLVTNPAGWAILATVAITGLVKGYDALIGRQEKLSRQKIEGLDEDISKLDEEIKTLEELQSKLEDAKGSRYKLSQIQSELNDAIGETKGLLNGESKAWDVANAKLKANIELKKQQRKQAQQDKVDESKDLYDSNSMEIDWRADLSGDKAREYAEALSWMNGKSFDEFYGSDEYNKLTNQQQSLLWEAVGFKNSYTEEWSNYWKEQIDTAYDVFEDTIANYDGAGGQDFIKGLISDMVQDGASLSEISEVVTQVINNQDMQDAINKYWESLVNPDINSEEALQAVKKIFDDIVAKNPALKDFFDNFYNGIVAGGKAATDTSSDVDKMTVSLSELEAASDKIKSLGAAYKELSSDGYITTKTLGEIQTATGLSGDEWTEYQNKLMGVKAGSSEFNQIMSDLTYKILDNAFASKDLNNLTEQQIATTLRENGVVNASAVAHDWLAKAKAKEKIASMELVKGSNLDIAALTSEASACGVTKNAYLELVAKEIIFNRNDLDVEDKVKKLNQIAVAAGVAGINMDNLNNKFGSQSAKNAYVEESGGKVVTTTTVTPNTFGAKPTMAPTIFFPSPFANGSNPLSLPTTQSIEYELPDGTKTKDFNEYYASVEMNKFSERIANAANNITIPNYSGAGGKSGSDKNEALDNYLKDAENRYKIHQDETKYIQELQYAYDNLTKDEKERLNIIGKINEAYRDLADNRIKDVEHQIDLVKELNEYADVTDYYKQIQKIAHEEANRLRAMGYDDNSNEIQELQKKWWDAQESMVDWRWDNSKRWIDDRNTYNDWGLFDDSEIDAWERVVKWLKEEYPNDIEKIKDAEKNLFEARKKEFDKGAGFGNTYLESQKTLLQSYYDVTNSIAEAQHEINKELETSKTMYEYLDEDTRKLLFNQEDYNALSEELLEIQDKADKLQKDYESDLRKSTLETVESITANYERQYETLMKSYEVAKADLEIAKKKQQLNNVLNERNVRMFINGQWQWVANTEDIANAKAELADAEYAKRVEEAGLTQQESINNLTKRQDELGVVIKQFENGVIDLDEAIKLAKNAIGSLPSALSSLYSKAPMNSFSSGGSYSSGGRVLQVGSDGKAPAGATIGDIIQTAGGNYKIVPAGTNGAEYNEASGHYSIKVGTVSSGGSSSGSNRNPISANKNGINISTVYIKQKNAKGTGYTQSGSMLAGEDGEEIFIDNNGHLIPVLQPTIFKDIEAGGKVFNGLQMKNLEPLWNLSNMNFNRSMPAMIERNQATSYIDNSIHINGMTISEQGNEDWIRGLRMYAYTHKGRM